MLNSLDFSGGSFHFIGIGGIGMSALAYVLAKQGKCVSGSDIRPSAITKRLEDLGVRVLWGHQAENLTLSSQVSKGTCAQLPQVISSSAIDPQNPEYRAAQDLTLPIFHRSDLLAALIQQYESVAVAGTHGKTTTSSLIAYLLLQAGLDPTIVVGGEVNAWNGNARLGQSPYLVAEADESDGSLVKLIPSVGVITNIELDHPDHYESLNQVIETFLTFAHHCKTLVACLDCPTVEQNLQPGDSYELIGYSLKGHPQARYRADRVSYGAEGTYARIWESETVLGKIHLRLLGEHNLSNTLAAIAVCRVWGVAFDDIAQALSSFNGARRRFEVRGQFKGAVLIDDYAHHPSEIRATLAAARLQKPNRVIAVFQPHRFSRALTLLEDFSRAFSDADVVIVSAIYSAGEVNPGTLSSEQFAQSIAAQHPAVHYQSSLEDVRQFLERFLAPGDLALFLGAGNLNQIIPQLLAAEPQEVVLS
ncbi:UDP-N-acetylmuramate--L-alanine ligase [Leptolyngbya sp. FACHB-261]|uniref:UDP-N-acetylmuramate--L-alanine ligase n=1 Tax=Leptolyngbya sp. FACHB-261 TaxID=2692806 RepID=UPI001682A5CD|nr:UDP-N-acetylmuramate--L-alanine ligase [Leptolyngbya sp. FACHB-261]MBD2104915.1 UDP-N-acetylmuramate--L-alanine ligase [Leptolyngbya sp. FACHB-261]